MHKLLISTGIYSCISYLLFLLFSCFYIGVRGRSQIYTRKVLWKYADGRISVRGRSRYSYAEGRAEEAFSTFVIPNHSLENVRGGSQLHQKRLFPPAYGGFVKKMRGRSHGIGPFLDFPLALPREFIRGRSHLERNLGLSFSVVRGRSHWAVLLLISPEFGL